MLDTDRRSTAARSPLPGIEFLRIELAPLIDGHILVSLTETTVDEEEPQLLDREIANERVPTIDAALALIARCVRSTPSPSISAIGR